MNGLNAELSRDDLQAAHDITIAISRLGTDSATWASKRELEPEKSSLPRKKGMLLGPRSRTGLGESDGTTGP